MGSDPKKDEDAESNEQPQHKVSLDEYFIGKYPVTNVQYAAFVQAERRQVPRHWKNGKIPAGKEQHPVVNVSWEDAVAFCKWASQATGRMIALPTKAQWEKAARGAPPSVPPFSPAQAGVNLVHYEGENRGRQGGLYPWGDEPPDANRCNFGNQVGDTTPVGRYSPQGDSPYGCADMAGNVWEWCADWYGGDYYQKSPTRNPSGPAEGYARVLRGGAFFNNRRFARCSYRDRLAPNYWSDDDGFRVGVSAPI
jgi:serine/threonine-protein kinase